MKVPRRQFLLLGAGAVALSAVLRPARAETYPSRQVRLLVGFAAGGGTDVVARLTGQLLSERLGQPFVIENRTGAGSNIAAEMVVNATADGYTLLLANTANAVNASLYNKLSFDFVRDIAPVAALLRAPNVMLVNPSFPANSVSEFIAYAKANPGKVNMGSGGNGGPVHMAGELFMMMAGVNLVHVAYRGEALAITDLLAGQIHAVFGSLSSSTAYVRGGKLRALAVTGATRSEALPDVPVMADFVPGYEMSTWYGIGTPKNTPTEVIDKLNTEINAVLVDPKFKARLPDLGGTVIGGPPSTMAKLVAEETEKWAKVVRFAGITPI
ncbi:Bug family tripartite tricarboxylate transporter substrate binding protein [Bradyrhizobium canariense]|uniref:Tripartite-type tricarboxylate transporter, receptor component TctC n=1 Tax=Bradyrhizobium canariense TaxID=255045 RepID=A0A1H1N3R7_9BRAD|nr:tripartite tricarboxylate transporter substrate binding protein [Bradyrhizobium canariense]SDR93528.1 Tripartite-type tricarboxylate transporter, receptor component TctC [Bradyrhizobium canariense]